MTTIAIEHKPARQRFEAVVEQHLCLLEYVRDGQTVAMNHVQVPKPVGGRGIAGELTRHALDWARSEGLKVVPNCPYIATWIKRHPDYQELL